LRHINQVICFRELRPNRHSFTGRCLRACGRSPRSEYLPPGKTPHCIDFILTSGGVEAEAATVVFTDKEPLPGGPGYVSDHVGLRASLVLAPASVVESGAPS
jgi:hypothetical protein